MRFGYETKAGEIRESQQHTAYLRAFGLTRVQRSGSNKYYVCLRYHG
jgi:hypothetical protein